MLTFKNVCLLESIHSVQRVMCWQSHRFITSLLQQQNQTFTCPWGDMCCVCVCVHTHTHTHSLPNFFIIHCLRVGSPTWGHFQECQTVSDFLVFVSKAQWINHSFLPLALHHMVLVQRNARWPQHINCSRIISGTVWVQAYFNHITAAILGAKKPFSCFLIGALMTSTDDSFFEKVSQRVVLLLTMNSSP